MLEFLVLYLSALSFGAFSWSTLGRKEKHFGLHFYLGLILLVFCLYFLTAALKIPVAQASTFTASLALVTGLGLIRKYRNHLSRSHLKSFIAHPLIVLPSAYVLAFVLFARPGYTPFFWDEFSHWALMPKQILLADRIASPQIPFTQFITYTPGWPLLLTYPLAVLGHTFHTAHLLWAPLLLNVGVIGIFFDFLKSALSQKGAWLMALIFIRLGYLPFYPGNLLIETPLRANIIAVFFIVLFGASQKFSVRNWVFVGATCGFGYLLKDAMMTLLVPVLFAFALTAWNKVDEVSRKKTKIALAFLGATAPLLICLGVWQSTIHGFQRAFVVAGGPLQSGVLATLASEKSKLILLKMLAALSHLLAQEWHLSILPLIAIGVTTFRRLHFSRRVLGAYFSLFVFYFFGLYWLYLNSFSEAEASSLASFDRYMGLLLQCGATVSALILALTLTQLDFGRLARFAFVFNAAFLLFTGAFVEQLQYSIHNINRQTKMTSIPKENSQLLDIIQEKQLNSPAILLVCSSDDWTGGLFHVRYQSVQNRLKPEYALLPGCWFAPHGSPPGAFTNFVTPQEMDDLIRQAQIVWLLGSHPWVAERMGRFINSSSGCTKPLESYFLVAQDGHPKTFQCIEKGR